MIIITTLPAITYFIPSFITSLISFAFYSFDENLYTMDTGADSENMNGFAYSFGFSLGMVGVIIVLTAASFYCTRMHSNSESSNDSNTTHDDHSAVTIDIGLDESTLRSYPKLLYSQAKLHKGETMASCCSICLADYKDSDSLRLLPDCGHVFHRKCVDPWLRLHPTCPVCRNSRASTPLATPLTTPLAEVAPLVARRD